MSSGSSAQTTKRRAVVSIALIGLVAASLLAGVNRLTEDRIAAERERHAQAALVALLPTDSFDNLPRQDAITIEPGPYGLPLLVYPARMGDELTALIADVTTPAGYSGDIRMLVAVDPAGVIIGVSVVEHRETPGLGDLIERRKSDWIEQFRSRSLDDPDSEGWAASRRGGEFDTLASATVTSQAVIRAVRNSLEVLAAEGLVGE
ncbi:MAG: RnfABCDGE type electron transport complex subunit G [Wenzhouxiangella sp.]|nr:RnfABCDGE type electron transport complex subunit G [Wenzhouxiangella sp.]